MAHVDYFKNEVRTILEEGYRPTIEEINVIDKLVKGVEGTLN